MSFIEGTPVGRLINRFGKDIDVVDKRLENCIHAFLQSIVGFLFAVGTVAYNTSPYFIVALIPLTILFGLVQVSAFRSFSPKCGSRVANTLCNTQN